jgi:geranyl-CoA carboxylase alpha subunit
MKQLTRLLIANRGEIVGRIARTARAMGIETVAVYSSADADAVHVGECDLAVPIGGVAPAETYRGVQKTIAPARTRGADAIHPGYGFLSENAAFAQAVSDAGLIFVGPPASAIAAMGDKAAARRRMAAAGIPVVSGYDGDDQSEPRLLEEAKRIGFPVMVKASAGGGGRGMRKVDAEKDFSASVRAAGSEAKKAFGDGRLILERAVEHPRHVEIQVFADTKGNVVHLGERDCSIQRRHQKVVEEAPSPAVNAQLRERMGEAAKTIATAIDYTGAGTVEFLLDRAGQFYFMEMNTRLQVEHPVTELITGLDLVEWQLRVARGEALPKRQQEIAFRGHAVEVRLCAEDPAKGFLPRTGEVLAWQPGGEARFDVALREGLVVSPYYDSMLGKIIAWSETRQAAIDKLVDAIERTALLGVTTNRSFLAKLLRSPAFTDGTKVSTSFIPEYFPDDASRADIANQVAWAIAAWIADAKSGETDLATDWSGWSNAQPLPRPCWLSQNGELRRGSVTIDGPNRTIEFDGEATTLEGAPVAGKWQRAEIGGQTHAYICAWRDDVLWLQLDGADFKFERETFRQPARNQQEQRDGIARAPLNGKVSQITVAAGDSVTTGQPLMVLEAMKMEHHILAAIAGRVKSISVSAGDQVVPGQMLAEIESAADAAPTRH